MSSFTLPGIWYAFVERRRYYYSLALSLSYGMNKMLDLPCCITHILIPLPSFYHFSFSPFVIDLYPDLPPVEGTVSLATVLVQTAGSSTSVASAFLTVHSLSRNVGVTRVQNQRAVPATRRHS